LQRNVRRVIIDSVTTQVVSDQAIDFEPSGDGGVKDVLIVNSHLNRGADNEGGLTVGVNSAKGVSIVNTKILDGGLAISNAENVIIDRVTIEGKPAETDYALHIFGRAIDIQIKTTSVILPAGSIPRPALRVNHWAGSSPTDILLNNVLIEQNTTADI